MSVKAQRIGTSLEEIDKAEKTITDALVQVHELQVKTIPDRKLARFFVRNKQKKLYDGLTLRKKFF